VPLSRAQRSAARTYTCDAPACSPRSRTSPAPSLQLRHERHRYHQQYLAKNPDGYYPDHGTGASCPVGMFAKES